jgi:hypothetical protein
VSWSFDEWTPDDEPGEVRPATDETWADLLRFYTGGHGNKPLERIFEMAREHGVVSIVIERRYIDADWRSEHSRFYGGTFRRYPSVCHRLHFFAADVPKDLDDLTALQGAYRGYAIMRPLPFSPVGRTMIQPPAELAAARKAEGREVVNLFGWPLEITAMPFISQDAQYLRCAHASIWMVLRHAHLVHRVPLRLPEDIQAACVGGLVVGRQLPSAGLSVPQMLAGMSRLGLSPGQLEVPKKEGAPPLTLYGIVCRYLNSELPPIVVSQQHAWVVVAWDRVPSPGHDELTLWRHDDAAGPYIRVDDPWNEPDKAHHPWASILTPMLQKMYIDAERAETTGQFWLSGVRISPTGNFTQAKRAEQDKDLTYRTFAVLASAYKTRLARRGIDPELARLYRLAHMPRYIWVVEAVDRAARRDGRPDVLGEMIMDATMSEYADMRDAGLVALHLEDFAFTYGPDHRETQSLQVQSTEAYVSDLFARGEDAPRPDSAS